MTSAVEAAPKIHEALAKLKLRPEVSEADLESVAKGLAVRALLQKASRPAVMRHGTLGALAELEQLNRAIVRLAEKIGGPEDLSPDARLALEQDGVDTIIPALCRLSDLNAAIVAAHGRLVAAKPVPTINKKPSDPAPLAIAKLVARSYRRLTGHDPEKRPGEFVWLLAGVLKALGVDASPEYVAKKLREGSKN